MRLSTWEHWITDKQAKTLNKLGSKFRHPYGIYWQIVLINDFLPMFSLNSTKLWLFLHWYQFLWHDSRHESNQFSVFFVNLDKKTFLRLNRSQLSVKMWVNKALQFRPNPKLSKNFKEFEALKRLASYGRLKYSN